MRLRLLLLAIIVGSLPVIVHATERSKESLAKLEASIVPAARSGDPFLMLKESGGLLNKPDATIESDINQILQKNGLPSLVELLIDARQQIAAVSGRQPRLSPMEMVIIVPFLKEQIDLNLADVKKIDVLDRRFDFPKEISRVEDLLWQVHVSKNRLANAMTLTETAATVRLNEKAKEQLIATLGEEKVKPLQTDFRELASSIRKLQNTIFVREAIVRIERLKMAEKILNESDAKFIDRIDAALSLKVDLPLLAKFKKNAKAGNIALRQTAFRDPDWLNKLERTAKETRKIAGKEIFQKSAALYAGIHWWFRGRYGAGPVANGLLKPENAASNPIAMFALLMPIEKPVPNDRINLARSIPTYQRRHHYLWRIKSQSVGYGLAGGDSQTSTNTTSTRVRMRTTRFY